MVIYGIYENSYNDSDFIEYFLTRADALERVEELNKRVSSGDIDNVFLYTISPVDVIEYGESND